MAESSYALAGKTVLITGAGRGIGADFARRVAARGARVSLVGLEPDELEGVTRDCGRGAIFFDCDVTDPQALEAAVEETVGVTGGLDVVVANAGILSAGLIRSINPAEFERTIEVNLLGVWRTVRAALPHVIERRGYIAAIASTSAISPEFAGLGAYSTSKAGVEAFARALRVEVAHLGVAVGVAYFHWIATDMVATAEEVPAFAFLRSRLRGPLGKTYPAARASEALVRGIERRAAVIAAPRWVRVALALRGLSGPVTAREILRSVPETAALYEAEVQRQGSDALRRSGAADARSEPDD